MESRGSHSSKKNENSILGQPNMRIVVSNLLPIDGKITDRILDLKGQQYVVWKKAIQFFFDEIGMSNNLTQESPMNSTKVKWIVNDRWLLKLVCNTLIVEVEDNTIQYQTIK